MIYCNSLIQKTLFSRIISFKQLASCWLRDFYIISCSLQVKQISFKDRFSFHCLTLDWTCVNYFCACGWRELILGDMIFLHTIFNSLSPKTTAVPSWLIEPSLLQLHEFWISVAMFEVVLLLCAKFFRRVWSVTWHTWQSPSKWMIFWDSSCAELTAFTKFDAFQALHCRLKCWYVFRSKRAKWNLWGSVSVGGEKSSKTVLL